MSSKETNFPVIFICSMACVAAVSRRPAVLWLSLVIDATRLRQGRRWVVSDAATGLSNMMLAHERLPRISFARLDELLSSSFDLLESQIVFLRLLQQL